MESTTRTTSSTEPSPAPEATDAGLGGIAIAVGLAWLVVIGYALHPTLPYSPVRLPGARMAHSFLWAPQGWSFFTRDPREEDRTVYVRRDSVWESAMLAPHDRLSNLGGLRRKSRAQMVELALLLEGIPADAWQPCAASLQECLGRIPQGRAVRNTAPAPSMCGTIAVMLQRPVPWAWARSSKPVTMPYRMLSLEVSC